MCSRCTCPSCRASAARTAPDWHREPFRLFFPLAVLLGWIGVGHWLLYALGVTSSFSGFLHGQVMMQGFMMAFAVGFLMTAVPRRTQAAPPSTFEIGAAIAPCWPFAAAALRQRWALAQLAYVGLFAPAAPVRACGASSRGGGARRPPASFVLCRSRVAHGLVGAVLIALASAPGAAPWMIGLGRLLVEQGVFLCLAVGVGSLVLPLMSGTPAARRPRVVAARTLEGGRLRRARPRDRASLVLEQVGWIRLGADPARRARRGRARGRRRRVAAAREAGPASPSRVDRPCG